MTGLSLDSVMGIQTFGTRPEPSLTVLASVGTTTAGFVAVLLLLCGDGGCAVGSAP